MSVSMSLKVKRVNSNMENPNQDNKKVKTDENAEKSPSEEPNNTHLNKKKDGEPRTTREEAGSSQAKQKNDTESNQYEENAKGSAEEEPPMNRPEPLSSEEMYDFIDELIEHFGFKEQLEKQKSEE